jgi:hypothetical protein
VRDEAGSGGVADGRAQPAAAVAGAVAAVIALLAGLLVGVVGSLEHRWGLGPVPLGLVLGLAGTFLVVVAGGVLVGRRGGAAAAFLGWLAATVVLSMSGPGSDVVLPADGVGYTWLLGGAVAAGLGLLPDHAGLARRLGVVEAPPTC